MMLNKKQFDVIELMLLQALFKIFQNFKKQFKKGFKSFNNFKKTSLQKNKPCLQPGLKLGDVCLIINN